MKKTIIAVLLLAVAVTVFLLGCGLGSSNTVQTCVVDQSPYRSKDVLEAATEQAELTAGEPVYASIHFIETPQDTRYTVRWYLDDTQLKEETQKTCEPMQDILVYELEGNKVNSGTLKMEIICHDIVLKTVIKEVKSEKE